MRFDRADDLASKSVIRLAPEWIGPIETRCGPVPFKVKGMPWAIRAVYSRVVFKSVHLRLSPTRFCVHAGRRRLAWIRR